MNIIDKAAITPDYTAFLTGDMAALTRDCNKTVQWINGFLQRVETHFKTRANLDSVDNVSEACLRFTLIMARGAIIIAYDNAVKDTPNFEEAIKHRTGCYKAVIAMVNVVAKEFGKFPF